ncbi:hypothetical protein [Mycoplasma sp. 5370]
MKQKVTLVKLTNEEIENIGGSFAFAAVLPYIPLMVSSIASLVASAKMATSSSGEIKTKEGLSQKWDSPTAKDNGNTKTINPIYFIY